MVQRCISVMLLLVTLFLVSGAPVQAEPWMERPFGMLFQRADGTYGYIVSTEDRVGQWQVAFGSPQLWLELVETNPQLADPDLIRPGDELNVPLSLVKLFRIIAEVDQTGGPRPVKTGNLPKVDKVYVEAEGESSDWLTALIVLVIFIIVACWAYLSQRKKTRKATKTLHKERLDWHKREMARESADPYSGPPVRENGLPTVESAAVYFTERYQELRRRNTVGEDESLPPVVQIIRIRPVDVKGPMQVRFASNINQVKDLDKWTPAWEATLSDGTVMYTLMACANDVRLGKGMSGLPETQVRAREDISVFEPEKPVQVWPPVTNSGETEEKAEVPEDKTVEIPIFDQVKITDPRRYVLRKTGEPETIIDLSILPLSITLSIENDEIFVYLNGQKELIGRISAQISSSEEEQSTLA